MQKYIDAKSVPLRDLNGRREKELELLLLECIKELKVARGDVSMADHLHPSSQLISKVRSALQPGATG